MFIYLLLPYFIQILLSVYSKNKVPFRLLGFFQFLFIFFFYQIT
ncbi:hypothetical protein DDB_G0277277 [Dictyostelium discoideum AX4]|uniref:Uncharacterized protein n=1 Tax=Dictyostelium discoideum TaxID=44689 RepID=Q54ZR5_DICDI|nr:hypothetical protein DDB_G0277277 [Dictyostelium discoideum AX4]EAL68825.1 hypothetical protein DDB_G0277277 [Dictyostelium discoideum AX4]|eukprot:XP_642801.1 hypothetical protein DDB_G0277277 [Dictyostelium discoideum AX4]